MYVNGISRQDIPDPDCSIVAARNQQIWVAHKFSLNYILSVAYVDSLRSGVVRHP